MRSGSNYVTEIIHEYIRRIDPSYTPLSAEITSWHYWWRHGAAAANETKDILEELGIDIIQVPLYMPEIYKALMNRDAFVYKEFPRDMKYISNTTKTKIIQERACCIALSRRSIIDSVVSYCIAKHNDTWVHYSHADTKAPDLAFDPEWVIGALSEYQHLYDAYKRYAKLNLIENVVYYEDLLFDPSFDIALFINDPVEFNFKCPTKKIISPALKAEFLQKYNIYPLLDAALKYYTFPYNEHYEFNLENL